MKWINTNPPKQCLLNAHQLADRTAGFPQDELVSVVSSKEALRLAFGFGLIGGLLF